MTMSSASREGSAGGQRACERRRRARLQRRPIAAGEHRGPKRCRRRRGVLLGNGTRVTLADVTQIRIAKSTATGAETAGQINTWSYLSNGGPVIDGQQLDFAPTSQPWQACARNNVAPADSAVITVTYTYRGRTPLRMLIPFFSQFTITDRTVMAMNASR